MCFGHYVRQLAPPHLIHTYDQSNLLIFLRINFFSVEAVNVFYMAQPIVDHTVFFCAHRRHDFHTAINGPTTIICLTSGHIDSKLNQQTSNLSRYVRQHSPILTVGQRTSPGKRSTIGSQNTGYQHANPRYFWHFAALINGRKKQGFLACEPPLLFY